MRENAQQILYRRNFLSIIKSIENNPPDNILFNGEKLKSIPLRGGTRQGYPFLQFLVSHFKKWYWEFRKRNTQIESIGKLRTQKLRS